MGVLDDAIREHLDLKRRHGADPAEVERAEREALGPVRRGPEDPLAMSAADQSPAGYNRLEHADAGWDQLAHDVGPPHDAAQHERHEDGYDYVEPPRAFGHADYVEPAEPSEPSQQHQDEPADRSAPGALEFTDEHDAPAGPETDPGRSPLPHQAPLGAFDAGEPAGHQPPRTPLGETVEYDVERSMESEPGDREPAGEDVLEETPEFLQDTPEHDRLWFEQRPPKDFDFDG